MIRILCALLLMTAAASAQDAPAPGAIRVATFNASLSRSGAGMAWRALAEARTAQVKRIARIIQIVRPDILLVQELDHDPEGLALAALQALLRAGQDGAEGVDYPHAFAAEVNTGVPSGLDLDRDGQIAGPGDAWGWGEFPGRYGMAVLSRFPIDAGALRSFRLLPWSAMPDALIPAEHYAETAAALRLSSKSHWDLPVTLPDGRRLHLLASHPTPPVFDGPEDRNGRRNHDEIRFWTEYLNGAAWILDDAGRAGGGPDGDAFVLLGDLNADPFDGDGRHGGIRALLAHPRLQDPRPESRGAAEAAQLQGGDNALHDGAPALDTADWNDRKGPGNLRVDFVLPSAALQVTGAGVFWPEKAAPGGKLVTGGKRPPSSDHRMVWVDIR